MARMKIEIKTPYFTKEYEIPEEKLGGALRLMEEFASAEDPDESGYNEPFISDEEMPFENEEVSEKQRYSGFLIVECEHCFSRQAFNHKTGIYKSKCKNCGEYTELRNMIPVYVECEECGSNFRYKTNVLSRQFSQKCISCGHMVKLRLNRRGTAYTTDIKKNWI